MDMEPAAPEVAGRDLFQGRFLAAFFKNVFAPVREFAPGGKIEERGDQAGDRL
jgi:hypothetical protein